MGVGHIYAQGARLNIISFSDLIVWIFELSYTQSFIYKVQINCVVYGHMDKSMEDMIIGSHN